jgi:hypothetical protein
MNNREIYNIKDKNSQEILLYLQKKDLEKNTKYLDCDYRKKFSNKIFMEDKSEENLPKTRMNQFLNNSFFTYEGNKSPSKSLSFETKEQTQIISTPQFIKDNSKQEININFTNRNNSQFSFFNENNINSNNINNNDMNSLNYLDFHLEENRNKSHENFSSNGDNHYHIYLPKKYKDDEEYKSRLYKFLKCETENIYSYPLSGIKTKDISPKKYLEAIPKMRKFISVRKKDVNKIIFFGNEEEKGFNFYDDENIGIDKNWQLSNFYKGFDNDVNSDEEQIEKGKNKMLNDLKMGIVRWSQNKNNCFNYKMLNSPVEMENIKRFSMSA